VHLDGTFFGCRSVIPQMTRNGGGSIINMSSVAALTGLSPYLAYSAAKGGIRSMTKSIAVYCREQNNNIRCNSIHPGIIDTPIMDPLFAAAEDPEALRAGIARNLPIGYMGDPARDIGNMAVYLAAESHRIWIDLQVDIVSILWVDPGFIVKMFCALFAPMLIDTERC